MEPILNAAEAALRLHVAPAVRLQELLGLVAVRMGHSTLRVEDLEAVLRSRPDRFRVLDPWRGPWRTLADWRDRPSGGPWVVVVSDPATDPASEPVTEAQPRLSTRIRDAVRWIGAGVDETSTAELARWHGMILQEDAVRSRLDHAA